jgi:hypothetical protein
MAMPAPVLLSEIRQRKQDKRTEADELRLELATLGSEIKAYAVRIHSAAAADDLRVVGNLSGRLWTLGHSYTHPEGAPDAA